MWTCLTSVACPQIANTPIVATNTLMFLLRTPEVMQRVMGEVTTAYRIGGGRLTDIAGRCSWFGTYVVVL